MTREDLQAASQALRDAGDAATDETVAARLHDHADQLARLAEADRGPDHGRLARHQHVLSDILEDADAAIRDDIEAARDRLSAYRETVEGV